MEGQILILHFEETVGFITPEQKISLADLGLSGMLTRFKYPAFWILWVIKANPLTGRLFVDVVSYHSGVRDVSESQVNSTQLALYKSISFKSLDTIGVYSSNRAEGAKGFTSNPGAVCR